MGKLGALQANSLSDRVHPTERAVHEDPAPDANFCDLRNDSLAPERICDATSGEDVPVADGRISNNCRCEDSRLTARVSKRRVHLVPDRVAWADEQCLAWFEATQDSRLVDNITGRRPSSMTVILKACLVPVRLRRRQVP